MDTCGSISFPWLMLLFVSNSLNFTGIGVTNLTNFRTPKKVRGDITVLWLALFTTGVYY